MSPLHLAIDGDFNTTTPADQLGKLLEIVSSDPEFSLLQKTLELYTLEVLRPTE